MCFSAEASFGAAAVIATVGIIAYKKADTKPLRLFALIPILFGVQQFFEGVVWISSTNEELAGLLKFSTYGFIFFAWLIWPVYIPFALWKLEKQVVRKKILVALTLVGLVAVFIGMYSILIYGVNATIQDCSINYKPGFKSSYPWIITIIYLTLTTLSHLVSSLSKVWILGVVNLITFFITKIYYQNYIISIWCFFAALSSLLILRIIISEKNDIKNTSINDR